MPLCPQITNTAVVVTSSGMTTTSVTPVVAANTVDINGKVKSYYQTSAPTSGMNAGDIWFDTDDGYKLYIYQGGSWVSVQDTAIAAAAAAATAAQTTADGKNKVYRQGTTPSGTFVIGDLWFNTASDNAISRWDGTSWVANALGNNALASISANKLNAGTIDASVITVSNINAGNISAGTLAAARIAAASLDASKIIAGTITTTQIAASTIVGSNIAAGTITASNITAGTITTTQLATGTLSATNISTGTLSASVALTAQSGTIGGWNISTDKIYTGTVSSPNQAIYSAGGALFTGTTTCSALGVNSNLTVGGTGTVTGDFTHGSSNQFLYLAASGTLRSAYTYGKAVTTARAMQINSAGDFGTTASTRRKKHEIQPYNINLNALLQLEVKSFKYLEEIDPTQTVQHGFIAEEAQALGLDELIQFDKDGIPDYFAYEKLSTFLLSLVQDLSKRVAELEAR
jgi:hypothetical protein